MQLSAGIQSGVYVCEKQGIHGRTRGNSVFLVSLCMLSTTLPPVSGHRFQPEQDQTGE
jgi:hypothetical protein